MLLSPGTAYISSRLTSLVAYKSSTLDVELRRGLPAEVSIVALSRVKMHFIAYPVCGNSDLFAALKVEQINTAGNRDRRAGDKRGRFGRQENDHRRHLFRLS